MLVRIVKFHHNARHGQCKIFVCSNQMWPLYRHDSVATVTYIAKSCCRKVHVGHGIPCCLSAWSAKCRATKISTNCAAAPLQFMRRSLAGRGTRLQHPRLPISATTTMTSNALTSVAVPGFSAALQQPQRTPLGLLGWRRTRKRLEWWVVPPDLDYCMRICGFKRQEIAGSWRQLHTVELDKLYSSQSNITNKIVETREARRAWHVTLVNETIKTQGDLFAKLEGKNFHARQRRMWHSTIKSNLQKIGRRVVASKYDLTIWNIVAHFWIGILNHRIGSSHDCIKIRIFWKVVPCCSANNHLSIILRGILSHETILLWVTNFLSPLTAENLSTWKF